MSYSVRIVNLDYCMCAPIQGLDVMYSEFRGTSINQVPVLRLFGSTATGKKICVHIHGIFPYFYIPYDGTQEVNSLMYQIAVNIDKAINISFNQASSTTQHVYKISLVSGISMYGYHTKQHQFLKIYLYNPILIRKVSTILMNETTLGKLYQPHETHLNFTLQFMIDYNLHGMSNAVFSEMKFRIDPKTTNRDINPDLLLPPTVQKVTVCELEGDVLAEHIVNRQEVASGNIGVNPGIAALWADEMQRRRNKGETSQIVHLLELKNTNVKPTESHYIYKRALLERLAVLSTDKPGKNFLEKLSISVYPAETPDNVNVQNASLIDIHTPSSLELSLNDLTSLSTGHLDDTVQTPLNDITISLDAEAQNLLEILQDLGENVKEDIEDDSILSQVINDVDEDDKDIDLSMPLEAITTPKKIIENKNENEDDELWDELDVTLIPQLDGEYDNTLENLENPVFSINKKCTKINYKNKKYINGYKISSDKKKLIKKVLFVNIEHENMNKKGRDMPLLDEDQEYNIKTNNFLVVRNENLNNPVDPNLAILEDCGCFKRKKIVKYKKKVENVFDKVATEKKEKNPSFKPRGLVVMSKQEDEIVVKKTRQRKPAYVKTLEEIKKLENRIKRMNRQEQLIKILRKLHEKESKISLLLSKKSMPKFKVVSKYKVHRTKTHKEKAACRSTILTENHDHESKLEKQPTSAPSAETNGRYYLRSSNRKDIKLKDTKQSNCSPKTVSKASNVIRRSPRLNVPKCTSEIPGQFEKFETNTILSSNSTGVNTLYLTNDDLPFKSIKLTKDPLVNGAVKKQSKRPTQKRIGRKVTPKFCISLDGTKDSSSSSDDDAIKLKRKRPSRTDESINSSRYSALPISIVSSPASSKNPRAPADSHLVSLNPIQNNKKKETPVNLNREQQAICDISVKRKLAFDNISSLHTTIIEEKVACRFSPKIQSKNYIYNTPTHINVEQISPVYGDNIQKGSSNDNTKEIFESLNEDFSDSDSNNDVNKSFFKSNQIRNKLNILTTAEQYDKETNFHAKEGTSKVFTPQGSQFSDSQKKSGEISFSSGSSSLDILNPYQRIIEKDEMKASQNSEECPDNVFSSGNSLNNAALSEELSKESLINYKEKWDISLNLNLTTISPYKKAPTRNDVIKSLDIYKIPHVNHIVPFYSDVKDVTGSIEVGYNVLKISSKTTAHLPEFESQSDSLNSFRKLKIETLASNLDWKKSNLKNLKLSFCKDRDCTIVPVKKPPSVEMVKNWIEEKSRKINTPVKNVEKFKIYIPLSPGNDGNDDDMNISLTISPCTPSNSQSTASQNALSETPKSSKTSSIETTSPVLGQKYRKHKKQLEQKFSCQTDTLLRKSLLLSQESSHNQSGQITGVSINNTYGFDKSTEDLQAARAVIEHQHLTLLVMEMHIRTRSDFKPNPEYDSIRAIFYSIFNDVPENHPKPTKCKGVIAINSLPLSPHTTNVPLLNGVGIDCDIIYVDSEENLLNEFLKLINYWDPDIIAGYEIEMLSWGYLIERAYVLGINFKPLLARTKDNSYKQKHEDGESEMKIVGRIVLDVWRLMRHEIALQSYTFESIVYHILHKRVPQYSFKDLSFWWDHKSTLYRHRTVHYYFFRVVTILELFDKLDLIGRTSELARLFGIQFYEVLSRGSQFRVESMMLRLAKPLNFIPVSPTVQQRAKMKAPEYIPLVLEPESKLYNDPVIVLDFQSLYPSIIIAYNYCFTTCIGRVESLGKNDPFEFGASQLKISRTKLEKLLKKDLLNFSPCGVAFVKNKVRDGILPRMLREILDTRLMVKNSMKENKNNQILQKVLHNRQLGLKLIANVTYGYTSANFSGRMPSVEIADSVVSKGRETLQRAIELVDNTSEWGARVVYGDTDSLFVLVPGRSKEYAFEVGNKIAEAVTNANPDPIKLKMEKVYQPCILQTKKRYVGYMYESPDQKEPVYDAKGIETVRRDGCPAVSKMLEKCLRLLFETKDVSLIKKYVLRQFNKILAGRASIQDLTFAKEYRGSSGYRPGACVPALELARKWTAVDKRNEPRNKERVPYIIVNGPPGLPLIRLVRSPRELLTDASLRPNALYYITKVIIPPINRCFNLIGADLNIWFNQMPRKQIQYLPSSVSPGKKSTISQYFSTTSCVGCGEQTSIGICDKCNTKPQQTTITLIEKLKKWEENYDNCNLICQSCTLSQTEVKCVSLDCAVLYRRIQTNRDIQQATYVRQLLLSSEFLF